MTENTVIQLPPETVKLITSTQIVTSVSTTVKELLENSIDAGGMIIQIRLENYGLDLIEVKDNGWGVSYDSVQKMFLPGYTSKIKHFEDLDKLCSYGFRGEALAAICKIAKVSITTKTNSDALAMTYDIDSSGLPTSSKPSHLTTGTVITVTNLFSNLPVRRLYLSAKKKLTEELKKTEHTVQSLSVIHPELNVSLIHNKCVIWKKNSVKGLKQSFMQAVTLKTVSKMDQISKSVNEIHLDMIVPKKKLNTVDDIFTNSTNSIYLYVNKRPITCKHLAQPVQEHIFHHYSSLKPPFKQAVCLISIELPPEFVDINIEPNKTKVLLRNEKNVITVMDDVLRTYYGHEDFRCAALRETNVEEEFSEKADETVSTANDSDQEGDARQSKKLKVEEKERKKPDEPTTVDKFIQRNADWNVEIINDETPGHKGEEKTSSNETSVDSSGLCSQINRENCVLTTPDEVSELNAVLNEKHHTVISTNTKNTITRLVERDELQCQTVTEKKILPDWPSRSISVTTTPSTDTQNSSSGTDNKDAHLALEALSEERNKTVEEIVAEIESDVEKWTATIEVPLEGEGSTIKKPHPDTGDVANFNLSMESVSSQMGKKEMKAFTKFARVMRPKIVAEFPKLVFTQVAALLAQRWKALTPAEVKYYEQMAETVDLQRLNHRQEKESCAPQTKNQTKKSSEQNFNSLLDEIKRKSKLNRPPRKEVIMVTSLAQIRKSMEASKLRKSNKSTEDPGLYRIIGRLHATIWLYVSGREIGHVSETSLREFVTYQKLLSNHAVEKKPLDAAVEVNEAVLGPVLWTVLISLDVEPCIEPNRFLVVSSVVEKNGFRVEMVKTNDVYTCGYITEVAANIPQFGVSDLKNALQLYLNNGQSGGLENWRPTSVQNYLMNTAVRQQQTSTKLDYSEMKDLMDTYNRSMRHLTPVCLRRKPLFHVIHHIQD